MTATVFSCSQIYICRAESGCRHNAHNFSRESTVQRQATTTFSGGVGWLSRTANWARSIASHRDSSSQEHGNQFDASNQEIA
jgi:hypothetical protein